MRPSHRDLSSFRHSMRTVIWLLVSTLCLAPLLLQAEETFKPFWGICYGPFREGQAPGGAYPTESEIREDMARNQRMAGNFRIYGLENTLYHIPAVAEELGMGCYPGAWIDNVAGDTQQVQWLMSMAASNFPTTKGLVVGNEFLYRNPGSFSTMTNYLRMVKSMTSKPVGAAEQWHIWRDFPLLANEVDFIMIHVHPYWENRNITNAADFVIDRYNFIVNMFPGKPVIIGETGWPDSGATRGEAVPGPANQQRFLQEFTGKAAAGNIQFMIFEMYNEPWKGVDDMWGLFDKDRKIKEPLRQVLRDKTRISSIEAMTGDVRLGLETFAGNSYSVATNGSLARTNWAACTNFFSEPATNRTGKILPVPSTTGLFYRLQLEL